MVVEDRRSARENCVCGFEGGGDCVSGWGTKKGGGGDPD